MSTLSFSRKSLIGRIVQSFAFLSLLLLILVSVGSFSLYRVNYADEYLYDKALPASEAARQLLQSSNLLVDNALQLADIKTESQRQQLLIKVENNHQKMLAAIASFDQLGVKAATDLTPAANEIIDELEQLSLQIGRKNELLNGLAQKGKTLVAAANTATGLLQAELNLVNASILSKLSLAYPQVTEKKVLPTLLDGLIEEDLDTQARLNRAIKLIHAIAQQGLFLQSVGQQSNSPNTFIVANSVTRSIDTSASSNEETSELNLQTLHYIDDVVRDPVRAKRLKVQLQLLLQLDESVKLYRHIQQVEQVQKALFTHISTRLNALNKSVDSAMTKLQQFAKIARQDDLKQLQWAKIGLWLTGLLMFVSILFLLKVIYRDIALRLANATSALSQLSLGNTDVTIDNNGEDELTAMASAITAFKQKTAHNQKLSAELEATAAELLEHKQALERKVSLRTQELANTNEQLDNEIKGHRAAREMAEQANQEKSLFLATMSHEIRTPLNGLLGTLSLLGQQQLPAAQRQLLALSQYSGSLLQTVLNDILDFSRLEQGALSNEARAVNLPELLNEVCSVMRSGAELAGLNLILDHDVLPKWVSLDGPKLRQVLFNLIGNGIKFTQLGEVRLKVSSKGARLYFEISDTGVGIETQAMKNLFIAYQTPGAIGRSRGTGLGLSICKQLIELMDTDSKQRPITVTSEVGKGSQFQFSLPLIPCEPVESAAATGIKAAKSKSVLVVEDNKVNALVAQGFLAHLGHQSVVLTTCEQVKQVYQADFAKQFDAIMLDIQLGDGSGVELLQYIQTINHQLQHQTAIAAFTAQVQADDVRTYFDAGFDFVLGKPLSMDELSQWLGAELERHPMDDSVTSQSLAAKPTRLDQAQLAQDREYLGIDAVKEMFDLYLASSKAQIADLRAYLETSSKAENESIQKSAQLELTKILHALSGSSASMGCIALAEACRHLNLALEQGDISVTESGQLLQQLINLWQESIGELKAGLFA